MKKVVKLTESDIKGLVKKILREDNEERNSRYMFFQNLQQMRRQCDLLLDLDEEMLESILEDGHDWAQDHIAEAKNNLDQVFDFLMNETKKTGMELSMSIDDKDMMGEGRKKKKDPNPCWKGYEMVGMKMKGGKEVPNCVPMKEEEMIQEAEYQGKKVTLNKPTRCRKNEEGCSKKFKVFVQDRDGVKKVQFGDPNMEIKRDNPKNRKSFRARHNCDNPGPKTKARYWSCKKW